DDSGIQRAPGRQMRSTADSRTTRKLRDRLNDLDCGGTDPSFKAQPGYRPAHLSKTARPLERRSSWKGRVQAVCDSSLPKSGPFSPVVKTTAMPNEPSATQPNRIHPAAGLAASARKTEMTTATTSRPSKSIGYFRKRFSPLRTP